MNANLNRRQFLSISGLAIGTTAAGLALTACGPNATGASGSSQGASANSISINSFGGTFQKTIQETVVDPFTAATGTRVNVTTAISSEALTQLKASASAFDVAYMDLAIIYQAKAAGLLQTIDHSKLKSIAELYPLAVDDKGYWIAELASMTGIAYNTEKVTTPPTSWEDLWDPKYAGKVAICNVGGTAGYQFLATMAKLNGGSESNIDPGFKKLKSLKPNLAAIWSTPDEMSKLLTSGEAVIGVWYADRTSALRKSGAPVAFVQPKEGAIAVLSAMVIPKGTKKIDAAHEYIDFQISSKVNAKFVQVVGEGPTNRTVKLSPSFLEANYVPYGEQQIKSLATVDAEAIATHLSDWTTRWQSEIAN
ncbi:ABC transporter substrate-binding protein [Arthrobacter wenxiniae]|uniref:ABC transporter substrate-binding protein n=1 Tax=Arthrobacter wenxiniae TaxID=2713570 RepID=A0A7Y7IFZ5_9MICC|nr:ABC transporter substrate-binding protein [Arthrobacter wenxiniae]NVM94305.1 ABC transporter substrate-binding protein [Arthrobacter wenxiniae]